MLRNVLAASALLWMAAPAWAEGLRVEPGKWEMRSTSHMPMMPQPRTQVTTECVRQTELSPDTFLEQAEGCRLIDSEASGSRIRWQMECQSEGRKMTADGAFTSTGTTVKGTMKLAMDAGGHQMTMEHQWEGRRLGPCD